MKHTIKPGDPAMVEASPSCESGAGRGFDCFQIFERWRTSPGCVMANGPLPVCPRCIRHYASICNSHPWINGTTSAADDPYAALRAVYEDAIKHASDGKGKERHAMPGEKFEDQKIGKINEWLGSNHGAIFQACKKAIESVRLSPEHAVGELLGALNYLALAIIWLRKRLAEEGP